MLPRPRTLVSRAMPVALSALLVIVSLVYLYRPPRSASSSTDYVHQHHPDLSSLDSGDPSSVPTITASSSTLPSSSLPAEYSLSINDDDSPVSEFCNDRFNTKYLDDIRSVSFQYCAASSYSSFTCFHSHTTDDSNSDSLCIAQGARFGVNVKDAPAFAVNCDLQYPGPDDAARGVIPFDNLRQYWYDTGPKFIIDKHIDFLPGFGEELPKKEASSSKEYHPRLFTLLVKREGEDNPWHCLMEIWSMTMTMDVLRTTIDPGDAMRRPYFREPEDMSNLQVVILDDRADGPFFSLWKLFSGRDPIRLDQIPANPMAMQFFSSANQRLILPLAGATNPIWQNDWQMRNCTRSDTLNVFVRRVLNHYGVQPPPATAGKKRSAVRVTVVDRKGANTRRLVNQDLLVNAARARYPDVDIAVVDFGSMSFAEQLNIAQSTDVLVGVHGAGLTHVMFLREKLTAVIEIQPSNMIDDYMGFRNIAAMRGISYFRTEATPVGANPVQATDTIDKTRPTTGEGTALRKRASWHTENFEMEIDVFVQTVGRGIQAVQQRQQHVQL